MLNCTISKFMNGDKDGELNNHITIPYLIMIAVDLIVIIIIIYLWCKINKVIRNNARKSNQDNAMLVMIGFLILG